MWEWDLTEDHKKKKKNGYVGLDGTMCFTGVEGDWRLVVFVESRKWWAILAMVEDAEGMKKSKKKEKAHDRCYSLEFLDSDTI
jgi:hypothetical protein